jgi:subtilisin family serine protease
VNILTTGVGSNYVTVSGTSFAAPHVAGLVALYIAANGRATNCCGLFKIRQAIVDNSLAQSQWRTNHTGDPDTQPEPLATASLNWVPSPTTLPIASQPTSQAINNGNNVSFGVIAVGLTFTYQWLFNGTNLSDNIRITGSTSSILTITNIGSSDAGNYKVIVTDIASNTTNTSTSAALTVLPSSLILDGSFESPVVSDPGNYDTILHTGDTFGRVWLVEHTDTSVAVYENQAVQAPYVYYHPTSAGAQFVDLDGVLRQDLSRPFYTGTNYTFSFLQSGRPFYLTVPAQVIVSIAPTGSTNEVYNQTFMVASNADWTRQQASFTVPSNGL